MENKEMARMKFRQSLAVSLVVNITLLILLLASIGCFDYPLFVLAQWITESVTIRVSI